MNMLNVVITEVENGYVVYEHNPGHDPYSFPNRKRWVAQNISELKDVIDELALDALDKQDEAQATK